MSNAKYILFFDGVCNLCNGSVDFVIQRDSRGLFQYASLQGQTAKRFLSPEELAQLESIVLRTPNGLLRKSSAVLFVLENLPGWKWTKILQLVPSFIRDLVYDFVAANRYRIWGKRESCRLPLPHEKERLLD